MAAPYSVRPVPGALVSTPLEWREVNTRLTPFRFNLNTIFKRIEKKGDLFRGALRCKNNFEKALNKFKLLSYNR